MKGSGARVAGIRSSGSRSGLDTSGLPQPPPPPPHMAKVNGNISRQKKMTKKQVHETIKRFQTTIGTDKT